MLYVFKLFLNNDKFSDKNNDKNNDKKLRGNMR